MLKNDFHKSVTTCIISGSKITHTVNIKLVEKIALLICKDLHFTLYCHLTLKVH